MLCDHIKYGAVCKKSVCLCYIYHQVLSRRQDQLKGVAGSKLHHALKAQLRLRACSSTMSAGPSYRAPLHSPLTSLRRTSARLKMLERRTTARFLHISPRSARASSRHISSEPKHQPAGELYPSSGEKGRRDNRTSAASQGMRYHTGRDRRTECYSKYIRTAVDGPSEGWHSAKFGSDYRWNHSEKEDTEDVSRTYLRQRLPRSRSDDGQNLPSAGKPEKPWRSAVLQRSGDGSFGRFIICLLYTSPSPRD